MAAGMAWGGAAHGADLAGADRVTWTAEEGNYRFGVMPFAALQTGGEWSLGAARDLELGAGRGAGSYLGAGLSLVRPLGGDVELETSELLDELELGAWVGGCVSCNLGRGASLGLEMRWTPDALLVGGDPFSGERRSGLFLRIPW